MLLIRPRAWWYNKVPLSVTLVLLLLDGSRLSGRALAVLLGVSITVCAMANFGYAVNELFDVEEDARSARTNAATALGPRRITMIALGSALATELLATWAAGAVGAAVTLLELCLPLAYSAPPLRLKERRWLGAASDALAAHVYPAVLALLAAGQWNLRTLPVGLTLCVLTWASATGLRGILSHQLYSADADRRAGLSTLAHKIGATRLKAFTVWVVLPIEASAFAASLILAHTGPVLLAVAAVYVALEVFKTRQGTFTVTVFRASGQPYLPLVEEGFYKAWGPLALAIDAARHDLLYLLVIPAYGLAFRMHLLIEWRRMLLIFDALMTKLPAGHSSGGS